MKEYHAEKRKRTVSRRKLRAVRAMQVTSPSSFAMARVRRWYFWLLERYPQDVRQEVSLVLLSMGVEDIDKPAVIDAAELGYMLCRAMKQFALDMGFARDIHGMPTQDCLIELPETVNKLSDWQAAWRAA